MEAGFANLRCPPPGQLAETAGNYTGKMLGRTIAAVTASTLIKSVAGPILSTQSGHAVVIVQAETVTKHVLVIGLCWRYVPWAGGSSCAVIRVVAALNCG